MSYTYGQAKDDLAGIVHGKTVNKITNINSAARRASNNLLATVDPDETVVVEQITLYDKVIDYATPTGLKEKRVLDIRPQFTTNNSRNSSDNLGSRLSKDFDLRRSSGSWFTVISNKGTPYIRIKAQLTPSAITLDALDTIGGWAVGGSAQTLAVEDIIYPEGAFQFNIAAGANPTTGYIQSTTINAADFTDLVNKSSGFFELYIPTAAALAAITGVNLRWGNDVTTKYLDRTVTTPHFGSLKVGKNLMRIDWNGATATGALTTTAIDSARITITTDGTAISGLIVSNLFFSIGKVWDIEYYSKFLVRNSAGVWKETFDDDTDIINLDTTSYNLFMYEFALAGLQQIQGKDASADRTYFYKELHGDGQKVGLYKEYKKNNPSQAEKPTRTYYGNLGWRGNNGDRYRRW